MSLLKRRN